MCLRTQESSITWTVQVFHFLKTKLLENKKNLFDSYTKALKRLLSGTYAKIRTLSANFCICALGRNRTYIKALEELCSIH